MGLSRHVRQKGTDMSNKAIFELIMIKTDEFAQISSTAQTGIIRDMTVRWTESHDNWTNRYQFARNYRDVVREAIRVSEENPYIWETWGEILQCLTYGV